MGGKRNVVSKVVVVRIGIAPEAELRQRSIDIAAGRRKRQRGEPKVWFTSLRSVSEVLNERNRELLRIIADEHPESLSALAARSGRKESNLSRTLKTLERYGLVNLVREESKLRPVARPMRFEIRAM
jgi:predicted transcriptional regulator